MIYQIKIYKYSPEKKDSPKAKDPTTEVPAKNKAPQLEDGHPTKICGTCNIKHEIRSPKFYELLIKTELAGETALYLKNLYKHIKMCLNAVTRLQEDPLPD